MKFTLFLIAALMLSFSLSTPQPAQASPWKETYDKVYPNGDVYYITGDLGDAWSRHEYARFTKIADDLARMGFRTIMVPNSTMMQLTEALENPRVRVIIYSGHGDPEGHIFDTNDRKIPWSLFQATSKSLRVFIFANCWGSRSKEKYKFPRQVNVYGWVGKTDTPTLFNYLKSDEFKEQLKGDLGLQ